MPDLTQWRATARLSIVLGLVCLCGGGAMARTAPQPQLAVPAFVDMAPALALPLPEKSEPFGLATANEGPLAARWRVLQSAIRMERKILTLCRTAPTICPSAASHYLAIIDAARARQGLARIGELNRAINLAIRPMSDMAQFGAADVWSTPLTTFASGAGDCEDYAIAKYVALRQLGVAAQDARLVIVHDRQTGEDHAVTAARHDGHWLILDNRTMMLLTDVHELFLTPIAALGGGDDNPVPTILAAPHRQALPALALVSAGFD